MNDRIDRALTSFSLTTDGDIVAAVRRLRQVSLGLEEAHRLGYRPTDDPPKALATVAIDFSRVYCTTQTPELAAAGAQWASSMSCYMTVRGSPPSIAEEWVYVAELLNRLAVAYVESHGDDDLMRELPDNAGDQIYTLDYRALGAVFPEHLVIRLHRATIAIEQALMGERPSNPLDDDEIILLRGLVAGRSISDLAADRGYSERSISRCLRNVWQRVGATSRAEGIATITAHGWLDAPATVPSR